MTFLFTDIEGSTRLWEERPVEMRAALTRHDEIIRSAIRDGDGYVFATGGDGFAVAFHTPADAVTVAAAIQQALAAEADRHAVELRVRMGIHTGAADERNGDYFGQAPTRAARIMSAAWGGQVLMSAATAAPVARAPPVDLGRHRLRDLPDAIELRQLVVGGVRQDFPPPRTASATPNNLPDQRTSFVGREQIMRDVLQAFESSRLVTLVGVGGVGKTRLAVHAAREMSAGASDGAWLCELMNAGDDEDVAGVVAAALGVRGQPGESAAESVVGFLRRRELLVVLDNCEHVVDGAAVLVEAILNDCPAVKVLTTSREGLAVPGERILAVPPLPTTGEHGNHGSPSVELFIERAVGQGADRNALEADTETIATICRRLDGLPLAIELAAARIGSLSPGDILARLDRRFRLLTGGVRRARGRQRTLEQTIDWSYELLSEKERVVFPRLAVIAASFDLATACAVAVTGDIDADDVVDIVDALVARSLLLADTGTSGGIRYRYLETIRHYAEARAEAAGELDPVSVAHATHMASWMQRCARESVSPDEQQWIAALRVELPNIARLVDWATQHDRASDVVAILGPFASRSQRVSHLLGPIAHSAVSEGLLDEPGRYGVLVLAAQHSANARDAAEAKRLAELAIADSGPNCFGAGQAHNVWQIANLLTAQTEHDYALGYQHSVTGVEWARQAHDDESLVHNLTGLIFSGERAGLAPDREAAAEAYETGQRTRCPDIISLGAFDLGITLFAEGQLDDALTRFDECAVAAEPDSFVGLSGACYAATAELLLGRTRACLARALDIIQRSHRQGNDLASAMTALVAATALTEFGRSAIAATILGSVDRPPVPQVVNDRLRAALDASLAQDDIDAALGQGAGLGIDELVHLVTTEVNEILDQPT